MNKIILSVGSDDKYLRNPHLINYLKSIDKNSNFDDNVLVYLGNNTPNIGLNKIRVFTVDPKSVIKNNINNCIQHGEFLNSSGFEVYSESDIIVFTDGDMTLQRNLNNHEVNIFRNLRDNDVFIGYNQSPDDTLENEYFRLHPISSSIPEEFNGKLKNIKVYNTGVIGMNKKTWNKLKNSYIEKNDSISVLFRHYAKQQWLICYILGTENYNIIEMGYDIHNHTHFSSPIGTTNDGGIVKYNNNIVLFKHRWF